MNRRTFLKSGFASLSVSSSNLFLGSGLGLLSTLSAASSAAPSDFKTLVMVFLHGGMDSLGLIVPSQNDAYERYKNIRQNLAFEQDTLIDFGLADFGAPAPISRTRSCVRLSRTRVMMADEGIDGSE